MVSVHPEVLETTKHKYGSDIVFVNQFADCMAGRLDPGEYCESSFKAYLRQNKLARIVRSGKLSELFVATVQWIRGEDVHDVDGFARRLWNQGVTNGTPVMLVSRLLYLNRPGEILPLDMFGRMALRCSSPDYAVFAQKAKDFQERYLVELSTALTQIEREMIQTEQEAEVRLDHLETIRLKYLLHQWLYWLGREYGTGRWTSTAGNRAMSRVDLAMGLQRPSRGGFRPF